jgi:hypothetical protein
MVVST